MNRHPLAACALVITTALTTGPAAAARTAGPGIMAATGASIVEAAAPAGQLVTRGPATSLADQLRYLRATWPDQHAVAVVTAAVDPTCRGTRGAAGATLRDCEIRVVPREYLAVRWLSGSPPGPAARFLLTYGSPPQAAPFSIRIGTDLLALLAPTPDRGILAATVLAPATDELVERVREALREAGP